jgi:hypothetical protein
LISAWFQISRLDYKSALLVDALEIQIEKLKSGLTAKSRGAPVGTDIRRSGTL